MNKKTVIYILGCVLVFVSAFMLLPVVCQPDL